MNYRDTQLMALRPTINADNTQAAALETFQNTTLRPILKYQHDLLIAIYQHSMVKRKMDFKSLSDVQQKASIEHTIQHDIGLKNRLSGCIIGHFTQAEYQFFQENETELNRRLTQLLIQRLQSAKEVLV
jgi:hypothetical protein